MTVIEKPKTKVPSRTHKPEKASAIATAHTQADTTEAQEPKGRDVLVPLDKLTLSDANVRKVHHEESLSELAALIESQGLLQRLSVVAAPDECYAVVAGGRRLRAMQALAQSGRWSPTQPVECKLYDEAAAVQVSVAENSGREEMHPADQMEAFRRLVDEGLTVPQVAGRFGVSVLTVERRLKLARLAPRFLDLYRADEIGSDQLQVLALIDDPSRQEQVWDSLGRYDRSAWRLKHAATAEACSADSRLARFVGLDAYEAEGGAVRRDLFCSPQDLSGIYLDNPELLQTLAMDKLRGVAAGVKAEGWRWVECQLDADATALRKMGRERQSQHEPTVEEAEIIERLVAEARRLNEAYERHEEEHDEKIEEESDPDADDYYEIEQQLCRALEQVDKQLSAARGHLDQWTPEQLERAGALVRLDARGEMVIDRGLVRPEDRKASQGKAHRNEADACEGDEGEAGDQGGEGDDGGTHESDADPSSDRPPARAEFSEKLMRDLTAHRTAAIQASLLQNLQVALVVLVHRMAETVFGLYGTGNDIVKVSVRVTGDSTLGEEASDYASTPAATLLGEAETQWGDRLPGDPEALFGWLLAQPQATLLELLAYCTARSVNAVSGRAHRQDHSDALIEALGVDMADWWVPTPTTYLKHVSKVKALEAVKEATGVDPSMAITGLKKADLVAHCAARLEGTRWLPTPLRLRPSAPLGAERDEA